MRQHIDFLDHIRGIAIIAVYLFHLMGAVCGVSHLPWGAWFVELNASTSFWLLLPCSLGWAGVPIFFVVSGFCIHLSFRRKPDWFDFFSRRFFRIYPAYLLALLIFAFVVPWTRINFSFTGAAQLGSHLALIHNLNSHTFYGINVAFWSIGVEAQLYLLYPLLLLGVRRLGWMKMLFCVGALEVLLHCVLGGVLVHTGSIPRWMSGIPFLYWFSWSIGALIAEAYISSQPLPFVRQSALLWGALAVVATYFKPISSFAFLFFSLTTAIVIAKLLAGWKPVFRLPRWASEHVRTAGLWSFSIYLLHAPFLYTECTPALASYFAVKFNLTHWPHPLLTLMVGLIFWPIVVGLSGICFRLVEQPSIKAGKWFIETTRHHLTSRAASGL